MNEHTPRSERWIEEMRAVFATSGLFPEMAEGRDPPFKIAPDTSKAAERAGICSEGPVVQLLYGTETVTGKRCTLDITHFRLAWIASDGSLRVSAPIGTKRVAHGTDAEVARRTEATGDALATEMAETCLDERT
jgi:hypothetical protein